jgi:hypothetical protein
MELCWKLTDRRSRSHCSKHVSVIDAVSGRCITYGVMNRVAFSPSDMIAEPEEPNIPSSQPVLCMSPNLLCFEEFS